jgi:hypothetical protein
MYRFPDHFVSNITKKNSENNSSWWFISKSGRSAA